MTTAILGQKGGNAVVPHDPNIARRTDWLLFDQASGNYSVTGTNSWVTSRARILFYSDTNGVWYMRFNISGNVTSGARTTQTVTINSILFKVSGRDQNVDVGTATGTQALKAIAQGNTNNIQITHNSATTVFYEISGDIELNAEPTTYTTDDNLQKIGADKYIASATSEKAGLIGGSEGIAVASGVVGEVIEDTGNTSTNTAGTAFDLNTEITLDKGLWLISGCVNFTKATSQTYAQVCLSTSGTPNQTGTQGKTLVGNDTTAHSVGEWVAANIPLQLAAVTSSTTYHLYCQCGVANNVTANGFISAARIG